MGFPFVDTTLRGEPMASMAAPSLIRQFFKWSPMSAIEV